MSQKDTYRYYCVTEATYIQESRVFGSAVPTVCKNNAGHTIDAASLTIYSSDNDVKDNFLATTDPLTTSDRNAGYDVGSKWVNTTSDIEYVCVDATNSSAIWRQSSVLYGTQYYYAENLAEVSTTLATFQTRVSLFGALSPSPVLPAGTYIVNWSFNWRRSATTNRFAARVTVDGTNYMTTDTPAPSSAATTVYTASGFFNITLASGTRVILLEYSSQGGGTSFISAARLELFRTS